MRIRTVVIGVVVAMAGTLLCAGTASASTTSWSDGDVLEAVVFSSGPAAHELAQVPVAGLSSRDLVRYRGEARSLVNEMLRSDGAAAAVADLRSGNPRKVEGALNALGDELKAAERAIYGDQAIADMERAMAEDQDSGYGACSLFLICVAAVGVVVVAAAAVAAAAAAHTVIKKWFKFWSADGEAEGTLARDAYVVKLAHSLA